MRFLRVFPAVVIVVAFIPAAARAQHALRGVVFARDGKVIRNANVFVLETLEGVVTGADGRFQINIADSVATLVARGIGYVPANRRVTAPLPDSVVITLERAAPTLSPITVTASSYTASEERTATLTPLEVVTIPGTAADVNRALQTLPGVQQVDEGTGLFVRGGDAYETKVFLNEAALLNPVEVQSPNGTFMGTVDPFLLSGITFSSGGFGARFGNALSAAVSLNTLRHPPKQAVSASIGLAGLSLSVAQPYSKAIGVRAAANVFDLRPLIALNGSSREYDPAPRGHDLSASFIAVSPKAGELTLFAIQQATKLGVAVTDPSYSGRFGFDELSNMIVAEWKKEGDRIKSTVTAAAGASRKNEVYGTFELRTHLSQQQLFTQHEWITSPALTIRAGGEIDDVGAAFTGTIPNTAIDVAPGSRTRVVGSDEDGLRTAAFTEADARIGGKLRAITGVRTDRSSLTDAWTVDPRVSIAYRAAGSLHITGAWGIYHQVPDPLLFDPTLGNGHLRSMRAMHSIVGFQSGDQAQMVRLELYHKDYSNLSRQTRDFGTATGLDGSSYGADLFLKGMTVLGLRGRLTYSYAHSVRTDADTRARAASPFDVPHTITAVLQRNIAGWEMGGAYRYATGRPFTPVTSASYSAIEQRWIPSYGNPSSDRLPDLRRLDFSVSRFMGLAPGWNIVTYASVNNILGRHNVYNYTYSADYKKRIPVASLFDRSLYFGATFLH
jgi:hypothetical protein